MNFSGSMNACMQAEGLMYDSVQMRWRNYAEPIKQACVDRVDPAHRPPSYSSLLSCLVGRAP